MCKIAHKHEFSQIAVSAVIPAKAGIQSFHMKSWIPACAGMTVDKTLV